MKEIRGERINTRTSISACMPSERVRLWHPECFRGPHCFIAMREVNCEVILKRFVFLFGPYIHLHTHKKTECTTSQTYRKQKLGRVKPTTGVTWQPRTLIFNFQSVQRKLLTFDRRVGDADLRPKRQ